MRRGLSYALHNIHPRKQPFSAVVLSSIVGRSGAIPGDLKAPSRGCQPHPLAQLKIRQIHLSSKPAYSVWPSNLQHVVLLKGVLLLFSDVIW